MMCKIYQKNFENRGHFNIQCVQDKSAPVVFVEYLSSVLRLRSPTFIRALS